MSRSNPSQTLASSAAAPPADPAARPQRADARRNYDLLIAAADAAFTEHGADASLEDIARRADVGIGTLYRHFPTREALLAKVLDEGTAAIVARANELAAAPSPMLGLARWLEALVGHVTMYRGLIESVAAAYATTGQPLCGNCNAIAAAGEVLVRRAQDAGELRADADPRDVVMAAHAAAWVGEQTQDPAAAARLLGTVLAGLRGDGVRTAPASPPRRAGRTAPASPVRRTPRPKRPPRAAASRAASRGRRRRT